jgi:hypothetical protein
MTEKWGFNSAQGEEIFLFPKVSRQILVTTQPLSQSVTGESTREQSEWSATLTTYIRLLPWLRKRGAILQLPYFITRYLNNNSDNFNFT